MSYGITGNVFEVTTLSKDLNPAPKIFVSDQTTGYTSTYSFTFIPTVEIPPNN
jgi:hypothetical protein